MKKIILVAFDLNPTKGSECGKAHLWLKIISKHYFVEVFTDAKHQADILKEKYENVHFNFIKVDDFVSQSLKNMKLINFVAPVFMRKCYTLIEKMIKQENYSLIHCITPAGIHTYNSLYKLGIPVIVGPIGGGLKIPPGFEQVFKKGKAFNKMRDAYYNWLIKKREWKEYFCNAKKIIVGTSYLKDLLPSECHKNTVIIFDTLVNPLKFKKAKHANNKNIKIFFSARMEPQKGCELLLKAFIPVAKKYKNVILEFAGEGSSLNYLKKMANEQNLSDRVNFLGLISRIEVSEILNKSDIFCLPTLREPGGVAILEAMACELPVITTNYGGPAYSVTKDCGIKIEPTNYDDYIKNLEEALIYLIENPKERMRMGKNGRKRIIAEFSPEAVEKKIMKVYDEVLKNRK